MLLTEMVQVQFLVKVNESHIQQLRLLLLLSNFSRVRLCATPQMGAGVGPPGSPVPGILQARTLEWVVISFSNAWQ